MFYNGLRIPTRQILDSRAIQAQLNNLRREIKKVNEKVYAAQVGCEQCKGPHYTKDFPIKEEGKTLEEAYYTQFGGPFQGGRYRAAAPGFYQRNNVIPSYKNEGTLMERYPKHFERKNGIDLEARLMGETLVINRSLDPYFEDYIELNDLNEAFKLRRNQGDDLMPTIEEGSFYEDVPIFVGKFSVVIDLCSIIKYGFKHYTNEQCNKIPPLLKMRRWKNGSYAGTLACMRWNGEGEAGESCQYGVFMHMIRHSHLSIWRIHAHDTAYSPDWPVFRYFLQVSQYGVSNVLDIAYRSPV
ncbi:hypothetical protein Tco_0408109 [Tanacetum coccineum]